MSVVDSNFEFDASNVQTMYGYSTDPNSSATVNLATGTGANFYVDAAHSGYSYIADPVAGTYSELSGFGSQTVTGPGGASYAYIYSTSHAVFVGDAAGSNFTNAGATSTYTGFPQLYLVGAGDGTDTTTLRTDGGSFVGAPALVTSAGN